MKLLLGHRAPHAVPPLVRAGALPVAAGLIFCMGGLLLLLAAYCMGFRINTSASLPRGLYRLVENSISQRGELAAFCLHRGALNGLISRRGYLPRSRQCPGGFAPLLKRAAGLPGDDYSITAAGVTIDGVLLAGTAQLPCDSRGRALPAPVRNQGRLPPGYYLLLGEAAASFDSRYLGPISEQQIIGRLRTLWTMPEHPGPKPVSPRQACVEQEPATPHPREWAFNPQPTHLVPLRN
ncbi:MAG: conjugative transfer signal peptidase TraF [Halieaceae bacterium]|nr:conjugative transfer signal peptidase TraF [Halieaceae bacterium]